MGGFLDSIMDLFGFTEHQSVIAVISFVFFLMSFLGGLMSGIVTAFSGPRPPRKLTDRISARMMLLMEIFLIAWILYYHAVLVSEVNASHAVYWFSTVVSGPILGLVGLEITSSIFGAKIRENKKRYKDFARKQRIQRSKIREAQLKADQAARLSKGR